MDIKGLDHANIRTAQMDRMVAWYRDVLGCAPGWRPDFGFPGAWLYRHGQPIVHLVEVEAVENGPAIGLEHVAMGATGKTAFRAHLQALGERFEEVDVPETTITQFNIWDPDGNHLHIDFTEE